MIERRTTRQVMAGCVPIGGDAPVTVQSMTNTDTRDVEATLRQIRALEDAGCEIIRLAVLDGECAEALKKIVPGAKVPLVADIHFDYRLALAVMEAGIAKVRINPGNIGSEARVREVVSSAKDHGVPIRIGVNGGSLPKDILARYGGPTPEALYEATMGHVKLLEKFNFQNIVLSLKASSAELTVRSTERISRACDYPLHIGVTEAGTSFSSTVKSSVGIGALLLQGIGDTIRVSITGDPVEEVKVGKAILKSLGYGKAGLEMISCPTCGRCQYNVEKVVREVERRLDPKLPLKVAVMGCVVNGPGEAREADLGIAGGKGSGILFMKGEKVKTVPESRYVEELVKAAENLAAAKRS
ncbi:flavodoxin-dependent (E)-4-hydroxy-3-methylbut-2-enyl-diphosphate synthase [Christensenellaceae bacterium NSJ-53]|uniref:4-hydroxy-3-methylbut-2-en-1-yl diphosphate synthase (flavodoxin) n=1 Tax=Gehongia tenuis TaxID=2763655 RepID=A0A926HPD8_9FIRM|nr:flavodoxin-dependent (E)-4-hydroxy-3-methylbut-2-enyl-diphosphate synthase [Gehongia tenuis]MBC8531108.1 flavodoxin-dependent (E)-4-hydroxy-3-methylbut-2-enyl-diphosphate synthase [Gehongia tenuis]